MTRPRVQTGGCARLETRPNAVAPAARGPGLISRRAYTVARAVSLLATVVVVVGWGPRAVQALQLDDLVFLTGALLAALILGHLRAPAAHFERSARPTPESVRVGLLVPVLLAVLAAEGWFWAAACNLVAELARPTRGRRRTAFDRILGSALRVPAWCAAALVQRWLRDAVAAAPSAGTILTFVAVATVFVLLVDLLWVDTLLAARQSRSLLSVWQRHLFDHSTLLTALGEAGWAYVMARVVLREGGAFGAAMLAPLIALAVVLVRLARVNARLHRLALSREAVDAMLRAHDPQPQMRSLLESIDVRIVRECVEVAAFGRRGADRWSRVVRFGAAVDPSLGRLGASVLLELQVTGEDAATESGDDGLVRAFAARDRDDRLRGALVVFRPAGAPALVAIRDFERAATEIGPLLGEYGAIAATRSAATIDTLTGLVNRRGVARAFEEAMTHVRGGGGYAVLLLDVDHFKSINDLLGHQTGDRALALIGKIIAENVRGVDVAGRFGGEEFLVLLRDASRDRALQVAERLRSAIETDGPAHADGKPVTVSVGVAYARAADGSSDVVERADRALYRAKRAGRNRVVESPLVAV
ncbi:MAG: GGDEF domain-containing protein [Candidatus Elarobacter sp.]